MSKTYLAGGLTAIVLASAAALSGIASKTSKPDSSGIEITAARVAQTQGIKDDYALKLTDFYGLEKGVYDSSKNPIEQKQIEGKAVRYNKIELIEGNQAGLVLHSPNSGIVALALYSNGKQVQYEVLGKSTDMINRMYSLEQFGQGNFQAIALNAEGQVVTTNSIFYNQMNPNYFQKKNDTMKS